MSPELHREAAVFAIAHQMSLNRFVEEAVSTFLSQQSR
ncbi:MAG: type II toxin-antitoxin system HicB family antitoxin [Clostridiales bacterium]|nr:type II toxin-antitoxin system HicB family antitoxin [Clostridiales bacterium]